MIRLLFAPPPPRYHPCAHCSCSPVLGAFKASTGRAGWWPPRARPPPVVAQQQLVRVPTCIAARAAGKERLWPPLGACGAAREQQLREPYLAALALPRSPMRTDMMPSTLPALPHHGQQMAWRRMACYLQWTRLLSHLRRACPARRRRRVAAVLYSARTQSPASAPAALADS